MARAEKYPQGTPCWVDLVTSDVGSAKSFYGQLFGWSFEERIIEFSGVELDYALAFNDEARVAGLYAPIEGMLGYGAQASWLLQIAVDDVDTVCEQVVKLGGAVLRGALEIGPHAGRMAIVADPTGGVATLWQANQHIGAEVKSEHGALTWAHLRSSDAPAAAEFFRSLLGIAAEPSPDPDYAEYIVLKAESDPVGGIEPLPEALAQRKVGSHWEIFFQVDDVDATCERAVTIGGEVTAPPTDIGNYERVAIITDPQGAKFGVLAPTQL